MKNYKYLMAFCILLISLVSVSAYEFNFEDNHMLEYDYYMDVGENSRIWLSNNFTNESEVVMIINATRYPMTYDSPSNRFYIDVTSSVEEDVRFNILELFTNSTNHYTSTSEDIESDFRLGNSTALATFRYNTTNHDIKTETHLTCAILKTGSVNRDARLYAGLKYNNETSIRWYNSDSFAVNDPTYQLYCKDIQFPILQENFTYYFGVKCESGCTKTQPIYVALDTNGTRVEDSYYFSNLTNNGVNFTAGNFLINSYEDAETILQGYVNGVMRFRIPFWYTFEMWYSNGTGVEPQRYENDFNYVYLNFRNTTVNSVPSTSSVNRFFSATLGWIPGVDNLYASSLDTELVMWGDYTSGSATVKLYEAGLYDINLLTHSSIGTTWSEEFYKPQQAKIELDNQITYLNITSETNSTISIYADKWEFDKVSVVVNLFKTVFIAFAIIVMLGMVALLPGGTKLISLTIPIIIAIMFKLFGWL